MVKPLKKIPVKKEEGEQALIISRIVCAGEGGGSSGGKIPVKKEEGKQAVGGGSGSSGGGGDASGKKEVKKVGNFEVEKDGSLRIPQNYEYTVNKKFIDEMFSLVKEGKDGKKEIDKVSKRLRDKEKGYQYNELKKMRALHYESMLLQASKGRIDLHYGKEGAPPLPHRTVSSPLLVELVRDGGRTEGPAPRLLEAEMVLGGNHSGSGRENDKVCGA